MTDEANEFGGGQFGGQFSSGNSSSFKVIIDDALRAVGVTTTDVSYRERALTFANMVQLDALKGRHWKFLNKELNMDLQAKYEAGTVTLTEGSYDVIEDVVTDALPVIQWNSNMVGAKFCPSGRTQEFYRPLEFANSKHMKLNSVFAGADAVNSSYRILFDRYKLDAKIQAVRSLTLSGIGEIKPIGLQKFRNMEANAPCRDGFPEYYTLVDYEEDTGQGTIEFYPAPDKRYACRIEYSERVLRPEDSETCYTPIPPQHIDVLHAGIVMHLYMYQENATMAQIVGSDYRATKMKFASDQDMVDSVARIQHQRKYFTRGNQRQYPGFFGLDWFGKVED